MSVFSVVTGNVTFNESYQEAAATTGLTTSNVAVPLTTTIAYTNAAGVANAGDVIFGYNLTMTSTQSVTFNLNTGVVSGISGYAAMIDPAGNVITGFARVREFTVLNTDPVLAHTVSVQQGSSNGFAALPPNGSPHILQGGGGRFNLADPASVGSSIGQMCVNSSSATVTLVAAAFTIATVKILIYGSSVQ